MTIYHIDKRYEGLGDKIIFYVSPYDLHSTISSYLTKYWVGNNSKIKRNIHGLFKFFKLASFNKKLLEKKAEKMNKKIG